MAASPRNPWPSQTTTVVPFRRRRRWTRAQDYGARPARRWNPLMVLLPLATFTGVYVLDGPPPAEALPRAAANASLVPRGWDTDPAALDAAQPEPDTLSAPGGWSTATVAVRFGRCGGAGGWDNCVIDGDTFRYSGEKIRIADINTPEVSSPGCAYEAQLGARATERLQALLNEGAFELERIDRDRDQYGRLLRVVTRGGTSVGATLVEEGLAERWQGYRRDWC